MIEFKASSNAAEDKPIPTPIQITAGPHIPRKGGARGLKRKTKKHHKNKKSKKHPTKRTQKRQ